MALRRSYSCLRDVKVVQETWDHLGRRDPFWAVLTNPGKEGGRWDPEEFFATGRDEIEELLEAVGELLPGRSRALDFGCGVGRLSQALAEHFDRVDGVDVAPSMVALAEEHAASREAPVGAAERCVFHLNQRPDLSLFGDGTFDLVYSNITLQHMETALAKLYVGEMLRVLVPGGAAVFQLPVEPRGSRLEKWVSERMPWLIPWLQRLRRKIRRRAPRWVYRLYRRTFKPGEPVPEDVPDPADDPFAPDEPRMEMHGLPVSEVAATLEQAGGRIRRIETWGDVGSEDWPSYRYVAQRPADR